MGLKEKIASAAETFNLTEKVFVSVNLDRRRMRPAPGTILVEVLGVNGETLILDTIKAPNAAPKGPWHVNGDPATFVTVGATGHAHQAFSCVIAKCPFNLPEHVHSKIDLGATHLNVWWSCEE